MTKYFSLFFIAFKQALSNKTSLIGLCFLLILLLLTYNQLWVVIGNQDGEKLNTYFIWYLLLGEIIILAPPRVDRTLDEDVKTGTLAYYINKPISFFLMRFTEAVAVMSATFIFLFSIGCIITFFLTKGIPFKPAYFPIIAAVCFFSCIINTFFKCIIGMCALWFSSTRHLNMVFERFAFIFGGAIFPLTIYPQWFENIARFTPFYSYYYLSNRLVFDFSWHNLGISVGANLFWLLCFGLICAYIYGKLNKKVEVYGG